MNSPRALALAAVAALALVGAAQANTPAAEGAARPEAAPAASAASHPLLPGSRLQGESTFRFFGLRVYRAALWTLPGFDPDRPATQPSLLELTYQRELRGEAIADRSLNEMRRAGGFSEAQAQRWLEQMRRIFPDVKDGDRLAGLHVPGEGARFWLNGRPAGAVTDPEFSRLFFGIWLAPTTSEPALRLALLGRDRPAPR